MLENNCFDGGCAGGHLLPESSRAGGTAGEKGFPGDQNLGNPSNDDSLAKQVSPKPSTSIIDIFRRRIDLNLYVVANPGSFRRLKLFLFEKTV